MEKLTAYFHTGNNKIKYLLGILVLMEIADGVLTNLLIKLGIAEEGNPLLMNVAGKPDLLILKLVGVLLAALIIWDINRRNPRLAFWIASVFVVAYIGIVAWNFNLLLTGI